MNAGQTPLFLWILCGAVLLCMGRAAARSGKPLRRMLSAAVCGMGALGAVNLLSPMTGVAIVLNQVTLFLAVVLGAPGVIAVLLLELLLK